ncbi:hypothetical protein [Apilactobacillus micheneri]|uniref:hypothetical protein n=1 Tax=Apilactobacillus micheneri TaxID=1899430 RepID=UPI001127C691|nr:hypothetical protein [Apilactobacillus micheneri]TPR38593.1 hypothetical protein DY119_06405 [Apilactobacillus micheneri]
MENEKLELKGLIDNLSATRKAVTAMCSYLDLFMLTYRGKLGNKGSLESMYIVLFQDNVLNNFEEILQDADHSTDDALVYLLDIQDKQNK